MNNSTVIGSDPHALLNNTEINHLGDQNSTTILANLLHHGRDLWKSPRGTVIRIEVLVGLTATMLVYVAIVGNFRRRSTNFLVQKGVMTAHILSSTLVTYTFGSMQSSAVKSGMYPIWALCLFILLGCADSVTSYSLDDNNKIWRKMKQALYYYVYVLLIIATVISQSAGAAPVVILTLVAAFKFLHRSVASSLASSPLNMNIMVVDHMKKEHTKNGVGTNYDPASMKGYHYLVDWPLYESKLEDAQAQAINIEKIFLCSDRSLSPVLKDVCLSFSLCHLLRRRFFEFVCGEAKIQKTRDFVLKGLLLTENGGATRAFEVIAVELAFLHDFFFTKYALIYYGSGLTTFWSLASASFTIVTAYLTTTRPWLQGGPFVVSNTTADVVITMLMLSSIALLELLQLLLYWTTIWGRVSFVCQYLREQQPNITGGSCSLRLKKLLTNMASSKSYWQDMLGQYSLLESVIYSTNPYITYMHTFLKCVYIIDFNAIRRIDGHDHRLSSKPGKPIKLSAQVKEAVAQSLKCTEGRLMNGASRLVSNGAGHLWWACEQARPDHTNCSEKNENHTHTILTWHIATCYCEMADQQKEEHTFHVEVAKALSKYCAYLVVSAPNLLPGCPNYTRRVFDEVAREAVPFLRRGSARDKYEAMRRDSLSAAQPMNFFSNGVKLGKQLDAMPTGRRWKVLADFWAEMILYLAPSDNVKEHIEQLAKGGEFITHLWALLSHAGILKRDPGSVCSFMPASSSGTNIPRPRTV